MTTCKEHARDELEKEWRERLDAYTRLIEVSRRAITIEEQQIKNYEAKIGILRESLQNLKTPRAQEALSV